MNKRRTLAAPSSVSEVTANDVPPAPEETVESPVNTFITFQLLQWRVDKARDEFAAHAREYINRRGVLFGEDKPAYNSLKKLETLESLMREAVAQENAK